MRCPTCNRRIELTAPTCSICSVRRCWACRLPEVHGCVPVKKVVVLEAVIGSKIVKL